LFFGLLLIGILSGCDELDSKSNKANFTDTDVDSVALVTELIRNDSSDYFLFKNRASLYLKMGNLDPALRDLSVAIDLNREDPDLFLMLGDIYFVLGQTDNAISSYKRAVELDPDGGKTLLKLAEVYLVLKQYDMALRYIDGAISRNAENSNAFYLKGILKMETGDTTSAITNLKIAANVDTTYYDAIMQTAGLLLDMGDSTAKTYYTKALRIRPNDESALFFLAMSYQEIGKYDQALDVYNQINGLYPANKHAFYNSGYIYMVEMLDFENAIQAFQSAIIIDPSFTNAVFNLGRCYEEIGRYDEARLQYKQTLELRINYALAIDGLNRLDNMQAPD